MITLTSRSSILKIGPAESFLRGNHCRNSIIKMRISFSFQPNDDSNPVTGLCVAAGHVEGEPG